MKQYFKNAFSGFVMLGAIAMPFASASAADGKISYFDLRAKKVEVQKLFPKMASKKIHIVLKVFGGKSDAMNKEIYLSAQKIEKDIDRDIAFLHAKDDNKEDGIVKIQVWAAGKHAETILLTISDLKNNTIESKLGLVIKKVDEERVISNKKLIDKAIEKLERQIKQHEKNINTLDRAIENSK